MAYPVDDAPIRLVTDASDRGMGAVLEQFVDHWRPLAFFSKKFTPRQSRYAAYDRELAAIYYSIREFAYLLEGRDFKVLTDHKPLIYAMSKSPEKMVDRRVR